MNTRRFLIVVVVVSLVIVASSWAVVRSHQAGSEAAPANASLLVSQGDAGREQGSDRRIVLPLCAVFVALLAGPFVRRAFRT